MGKGKGGETELEKKKGWRGRKSSSLLPGGQTKKDAQFKLRPAKTSLSACPMSGPALILDAAEDRATGLQPTTRPTSHHPPPRNPRTQPLLTPDPQPTQLATTDSRPTTRPTSRYLPPNRTPPDHTRLPPDPQRTYYPLMQPILTPDARAGRPASTDP